jgi:hypothetical protein
MPSEPQLISDHAMVDSSTPVPYMIDDSMHDLGRLILRAHRYEDLTHRFQILMLSSKRLPTNRLICNN